MADDDLHYQKVIQKEENTLDNNAAPITSLPYNVPNTQSVFENTPNSSQMAINNSISQYPPQNNQFATPYEVNNPNNHVNKTYYSSHGVIYSPPQNSNQVFLNTDNNFEGIKNISELPTKYISQPNDNIFIIKKRCTTSYFGVFIWYLALSAFIAIGIFVDSYIFVVFCVFMGSIPLIGLCWWVFSYKIILEENSIIIKENKCCRSSQKIYLPGEINGFMSMQNNIMFQDNHGNRKEIGVQDYTIGEINYLVYKVNTHIETKMRTN